MKKEIKITLVLATASFFAGIFFHYAHSQDATLPVPENTSAANSATLNTTDTTIIEKDTAESNSTTVTPETITNETDGPVLTDRNIDEEDTTSTDATQPTADTSYKPTLKINIGPDVVVFLVKARGADRVECYMEREGADSPIFIGAARKIQEELWELKVDIHSKIPNGTFNGFSKIYDGDGIYRTDKVIFSVNQPVSSSSISSSSTTSAPIQTAPASPPASNQEQPVAGSQPVNLGNDFDRDGIPNEDEKRLGTNPLQADSDQDGFLDGDELRNGFNPLKFSPGDKSDKIVFQSPKDKGTVDEVYAVENIEMKNDPEKGNSYKLSGKALPNIYLTIYIYSDDPIVVTVKTDENGNWTYELDKDLEDGDHEVYVAMTDNSGKITAKSNPLKFVKTAQAVSVAKDSRPYETVQLSAEKQKSNALLYATIIATLFLGAALALIGFVTTHHKEKNEGTN